ncbi:Hypothetical predicted protein [Paramuricea clavata]|uniref:LRRC8 pannexin-like TM region domain-containing protein n=1 Tax=Paramuricea clavata TaxID=317549 RepID=A0A7D9HTE8_PARCT|nr:Hypothetical predicted protein [Paramuricea clavata]
MLLSGDLLKLHVQSEAEKFLKPWWDVVIDYLILVLVMIAVVCGVVGLYASGPVCIPVLRCPPQENSSALNKITCATIYNSSRKGEDSLDIAVQFTSRNMFDYVNSECGEDIFWMVRFFPNVLIVIAGYCVVCNNAWFVLKSPTLEQMSDLLHDCYKHAYNNPTSRESAENRSQVKTKLKEFVRDFEGNDSTNCLCCPNSCSIEKSYFIISVVQTVVAAVIFVILVWLTDKMMNRQYECNIDEIIPGLVYDHFACTYSIVKFYSFGAGVFSTIFGVYMGFSCLKLVSAIKLQWFLKTVQLTKINTLNIESLDLIFLLKLVALSNSAYLEPFRIMYEERND